MDLAESYFGKSKVLSLIPRMTAEDFSYFSQQAPSCYFRIGTKKKSEPITNIHTSTFDIDEESIKNAMGFSAYLAIYSLNQS